MCKSDRAFSPDAVLFDVDGVLWAAQDAYNACTLYVARKLARENDWPDAGLSLEDIRAFKRSGGFNSDWDMVWALVVMLQARAEGRIPPEKTWLDLAAENAGQGIPWAQRYAGPDAPDFDALQRYYDAHYWGADMYPAIYDTGPVVVHRPGFARAEHAYAAPDFFYRLKALGVKNVGIITGRNRNEMRTPLAALDFAGLLRSHVILTHEMGQKPDPQLMVRAVEGLQASQVIMVGDSVDDLRLVIRYRELPRATAQVQFVAIDHEQNPQRWWDLGADAVLQDVNQLVAWLKNGRDNLNESR